MVGRTLSHYKVPEEISRGGTGIAYRSVGLSLNRDVALKVLPLELVADQSTVAALFSRPGAPPRHSRT